MDIKQETWGKYKLIIVADPETNFLVKLSTFGATLVDIQLPDRNGDLSSVTYSHSSPEDYKNKVGYFGASVGRVANRIGNAKFELDGEVYSLNKNNGKHCLHGGKKGFSYKEWVLEGIRHDSMKNNVRITFQYISPDGEEGFPGQMTTQITYIVSPMSIGWEFTASTTKPSIVNLTNHAYWNLNGLHSSIESHDLTLYADSFSINDDSCLPTGELGNVAEYNVDFREKRNIKLALEQFGDIDNNFFLTGYQFKKDKTDLFLAAKLWSPLSGRKMVVETTEPCIQIYTGNFMGNIVANGIKCKKHSAICLETQKIPNAINLPEFADSVILRPDEKYYHKTVHTFSIQK
ncbi:hypothetical protein NEF87_005007 [Candidatus Lokiarchaeum ossiferum]|uniref:aldose 1-epimerase n=1 Tax=Candidatus Lokiarchaeum ossiferum TaxID=2951803 RepID=A0ABY6HYX2_9ARCH|nr:hypothetical protein NEF87_005007 [Candidatus Lokiarchaeum sp. B-35]